MPETTDLQRPMAAARSSTNGVRAASGGRATSSAAHLQSKGINKRSSQRSPSWRAQRTAKQRGIGFEIDAMRRQEHIERRARACMRHELASHAVELRAVPTLAVVLVIPRLPGVQPPSPVAALEAELSVSTPSSSGSNSAAAAAAGDAGAAVPAPVAVGPFFLSVFSGATWTLPLMAPVHTRRQRRATDGSNQQGQPHSETREAAETSGGAVSAAAASSASSSPANSTAGESLDPLAKSAAAAANSKPEKGQFSLDGLSVLQRAAAVRTGTAQRGIQLESVASFGAVAVNLASCDPWVGGSLSCGSCRAVACTARGRVVRWSAPGTDGVPRFDEEGTDLTTLEGDGIAGSAMARAAIGSSMGGTTGRARYDPRQWQLTWAGVSRAIQKRSSRPSLVPLSGQHADDLVTSATVAFDPRWRVSGVTQSGRLVGKHPPLVIAQPLAAESIASSCAPPSLACLESTDGLFPAWVASRKSCKEMLRKAGLGSRGAGGANAKTAASSSQGTAAVSLHSSDIEGISLDWDSALAEGTDQESQAQGESSASSAASTAGDRTTIPSRRNPRRSVDSVGTDGQSQGQLQAKEVLQRMRAANASGRHHELPTVDRVIVDVRGTDGPWMNGLHEAPSTLRIREVPPHHNTLSRRSTIRSKPPASLTSSSGATGRVSQANVVSRQEFVERPG